MAKCARCGKSPLFGQSRSHSLKATKRQFKANVQRTTVYEHGKKKRVHMCTRCIKTMSKTRA